MSAGSYSLVNVFAALPRTQRGSFVILGSDPKGKNFLYVNGNSVFIRNISDPFDCDVYTEHAQQVQVAKYSPSGYYIASADQSGKVRIWDTTNKEHLLKNEFQPISGVIKDLQWSSDNQRIIIGGEGREKFGHVFNAETGTSVGEIMGTSKAINSVDFKSSRPFRAVVASEDNSICYFEGPPFKWKKSINEHDRFVNVVRYSPNGDRFASGGADGKLIIFDGKTGDKLYEINSNNGAAHSGSIYGLCWDSSSQKLITVSGDKTAKLWNVDSKSLIREFKFGDAVDDQQVGCLWQNEHILTVSLSGKLNYLKENEQSAVRTIKGHSKSVTALEIAHANSENPIIFSGSHDGLIIHWNSTNGQMDSIQSLNSINQHTNQVQSMSFDNKSNILISCGLDDTIKFIDVAQFKYIKELKLDSQPQGVDNGGLNGGAVVVACTSKLLLIRNKEIVSNLSLNYEATCVSVAKQKNQCAVGSKDNKVRIYEFNNDKFNEIKTLTERDFITSIRYSNNDAYLAVADNAKNVKCYSVNDFNDITRDLWQHHAGRITSISWSPDSTHLATSSVDTHCFIYSPSKINNYIQIKNAHPLNPLSACVWLDNKHLITSSQDCCLRKWKLNI